MSIDYDPRHEASQLFFKTVQNKLHWAAHGHTAAEVIGCDLREGLIRFLHQRAHGAHLPTIRSAAVDREEEPGSEPANRGGAAESSDASVHRS